MNNWKCEKCNAGNAGGQRFCGSCGQPKTTETPAQISATELPPTIMAGYVPQAPAPPLDVSSSQNRFQPPSQPSYQSQNQFHNQSNKQNHSQSQSIPPNQSQAFFSAPSFAHAPPVQPVSYSQPETKKSFLKPLLIIGGIGGFFVVAIIGVILWLAVINPYLKEQARIKEEARKQERANMTAALSLLPNDFNVAAQPYRRTKTYSRSDVLQASKELPAEMQEGSENVIDASAAEYANAANSDQKIIVQVFKFNSPSKAVEKCEQVGQALQRRKDLFNRVDSYGKNLSYPTQCVTSADGKTGGGLLLRTRYGFLYVATGLKDSLSSAIIPIDNTLSY